MGRHIVKQDNTRTPEARRRTIDRKAARHLKSGRYMPDLELSALKIGGAL